MPYIKKNKRKDIQYSIPNNTGELNYLITLIINDYLIYSDAKNGKLKPVNYKKINDILGALEGCKQEFYRRVAVPYEEKKIKENGDVY